MVWCTLVTSVADVLSVAGSLLHCCGLLLSSIKNSPHSLLRRGTTAPLRNSSSESYLHRFFRRLRTCTATSPPSVKQNRSTAKSSRPSGPWRPTLASGPPRRRLSRASTSRTSALRPPEPTLMEATAIRATRPRTSPTKRRWPLRRPSQRRTILR